MRTRHGLGLITAALVGAYPAMGQEGDGAQAAATPDTELRRETIIVTARRVAEDVQDVPIAVSVVGSERIAEAGAFNVGKLRELVPTLQFYSSNPRNTAVTIRGLGAPFGLTNDGLDPGVGLYVDGVFLARPAATTLDFLDVEQIEVLRGPRQEHDIRRREHHHTQAGVHA